MSQAKKKSETFAVGDIVRHKGSFLRSVSWYTNVPRNGKVLGVDNGRGGEPTYTLLDVAWSDGTRCRVFSGNVMLASKPDRT